jgi:hypothetical protein
MLVSVSIRDPARAIKLSLVHNAFGKRLSQVLVHEVKKTLNQLPSQVLLQTPDTP